MKSLTQPIGVANSHARQRRAPWLPHRIKTDNHRNTTLQFGCRLMICQAQGVLLSCQHKLPDENAKLGHTRQQLALRDSLGFKPVKPDVMSQCIMPTQLAVESALQLKKVGAMPGIDLGGRRHMPFNGMSTHAATGD